MESKKNKLFQRFAWKKVLRLILIAVVLFAGFGFCFHYIFSRNYITGGSMIPTFLDGDHVMTIRHTPINRGDIIILKAPDKKDELYIKRVIGLPGDSITSKNDKLYINGKRYHEDFLKEGAKLKEPADSVFGNMPYTYTYSFTLRSLAQTDDWHRIYSKAYLKKIQANNKVPANNYFVMGDHRVVSNDSRVIGFIKHDAIVGRVALRYWPFDRLTLY